MLANPIPGLHMIRMGVFGESGRLGLLRGEEALLLPSEFKQPIRRFSVRLGDNTILQDSCRYMNRDTSANCPTNEPSA
jgi:hypothetical protein